jgi:hypothetical protein
MNAKSNLNFAFEMSKLQFSNATRKYGCPDAFGKPFPEFEISKTEFGF